MKLYVYVFDDNADRVERCFAELKNAASVDVSELKGGPLVGYKLAFEIQSLSSSPINVLVRFSESMNSHELETEINDIHEAFDLFLIDDHYPFDPLAGQNFIIPRLAKRFGRNRSLSLPVFCLFTEHYAIEPSRVMNFRAVSETLSADNKLVIGIPKEPARLVETLRWTAMLKRAAESESRALATLKVAGLDNEFQLNGVHQSDQGLAGNSKWLQCDSTVARAIAAEIDRVARFDAPVLVYGETGTGKTDIARRIHDASTRAAGPFEIVNFGEFSEGLIESELFGHESGAFSGATGRRTGKLRTADGGTVFIDEIEKMSLSTQARLYTFLDTQTVSPVGSDKRERVNVRIITAAHDLDAAVNRGEFRSDLRFRLKVLQLRVLPLRERGDDVWQLAEHFARIHSPEFAPGRGGVSISPDLRPRLLDFDWPGNVRQLQNMVKSALTYLAAGETVLQLKHFGDLAGATNCSTARPPGWSYPAEMRMDRRVVESYVECVTRCVRERNGSNGISLTEIGLIASRYKPDLELARRPPQAPQKAFINHLNANARDWSMFLHANGKALAPGVVNVFLLSKRIRNEFEKS